MPAENSQLLGLCPHPVNRSGSNVAPGIVVPNEAFAIAPQLSPPDAVRFCAAPLERLQSTTKFLFESAQLRVVLVCSAFTGFGDVPNPFSVCPNRYLFAATFTAVLPVPRTS